MKRIVSAALLLVLACPPAWGASLKIPAEVKAQPGKWVVVAPDTDCVAVDYVGLDDLEAFPSSELKDPRRLVVQAPTAPGRWRFVAVGTLKDELARADFVIVVGDAPPAPPGPPQPPQPPPVPDDPLAKTLQAAYAAEAGAGKAGHLALLAALYRNAGPTCQRADLKTAGDLLAVLRQAAAALLPADALPKVRRAVADELNKGLPADPAAALDQAARDKAAAAFARVATALGTVKEAK